MSDKTFTCPRRIADGRTVPGRFGGDGENKDRWRHDGTCSYDGSFSGEAFMEYVRAGHEVGSTDKGYKFYLPDWDDRVRGAAKFYTHHLEPKQSQEFFDRYLAGRINFGMYPPYTNLYLPGAVDPRA